MVSNLFIRAPIESDQDVTEYQFGFIVQSIAGKSVEEIKGENNDAEMTEETKEPESEKPTEEAKEPKRVEENEFKLLEK